MQPTASQSQEGPHFKRSSICTSRWSIAEYWAVHQNRDEHFVVDLGEPSCFACGYWDPKWDSYNSAAECWNNATLERAHIIANSIGGQDAPRNYLLLCAECHSAAPMSNDPQWMLLWAKSRERWADRLVRSLKEEFFRMGGTQADIQRLADAGDVNWELAYRSLQLDGHPGNPKFAPCAANGALMAIHVARKLVDQEAIFPALAAKPRPTPEWLMPAPQAPDEGVAV